MVHGPPSAAVVRHLPPHAVESAVLGSNLENAVETEEVEGGTARLEDDDVGSDEERRLARSVSGFATD